MAEIYEDWLSSKMTKEELNELTDEDKKERRRLQKINKSRKYRERNPEKVKETKRKYYQEHKLEKAAYDQSPIGKKLNTIAQWKRNDQQETEEELDRIYDMWLHQEFCNACDVKLTRNGDNHSTQACMDHCHITHRFRHIICRSCNNNDKWKEYFC